jgi:hypothetical protein
MGEAGIFGEDDRVELIDGAVMRMSPIGWRHIWCVRQLNRMLVLFSRTSVRLAAISTKRTCKTLSSSTSTSSRSPTSSFSKTRP